MADKSKKFRKRPNKKEIEREAKLRGHFTNNEKLMLKGLTVKNSLQRIYNKAFDDSLNKTTCKKLEKAMEEFNSVVESLLPRKSTDN